MPPFLESLDLSVTTAHWDDRDHRGAPIHRVGNGAQGPFNRLAGGNEWGAEKNENGKIDCVIRQKRCRAIEARQIESLVEIGHRDRMNRFESDCNFQPPGKPSRELESRRTDGVRVRLYGDPTKRRSQRRNFVKILAWHGPLVEEVARVIQFQSVWGRAVERLQNFSQLRRERAGRRRTFDRPAPQITERAGERTFGANEKNREDVLDLTARAALDFD